MARTLLDAVNLLLTQVREVDSRGVLTSLTDSAKQTKIDLAVRAWNNVTALLYEQSHLPVPTQTREADIVLQTGKRIYPLAADLIHLFWPLRHKDAAEQEGRGYQIYPYAPDEPDAGYMRLMREDLRPTQNQGRPLRAAFTPDRRELYLDRTPTSAENGDIYTYTYSKRFYLSGAGDTFPFGDATVDALVPAAAELWRGDYQATRDNPIFRAFMATAARTMNPNPLRGHW